MKILLVYPQYPDTFWSFKHALKFISKKAANPPLGLITVASILPENWEKKLIDLNVESLKSKDIIWADFVFISAMNVQLKSVFEIIWKCRSQKTKIVAGGPFFTAEYLRFSKIDHFILNEAEITLPKFLNDFNKGQLKRIYQTTEYAELRDSPLPDYSLIKQSKYSSLSIQYTRGCPYNCEFCDITALLGHKVRTKLPNQIINELNNIYDAGWRKAVFFVDDNFIGNKKTLKGELLPLIIEWMKSKNYPFSFTTEASIDLADDNELMSLMIKAGFESVFIGIETTEEKSLTECSKIQNKNRSLVESVRRIQDHGIEVSGGFIVGFDNDSKQVFQNQIDFIEKSGIITAMVGLLNVPRKTRLYKRLKNEGRIIQETSGNNTDYSLNFIPKMNTDELVKGYKKVLNRIYSGELYYKRVLEFLRRFYPTERVKKKRSLSVIVAFFKSVIILGIVDKFRSSYWKLVFWSLFNRPQLLTKAITYSVYGYHFRKVFKEVL
jgi:radical SAM superfamily enzyme YgiQ (UPF0313 family)